MNRREARGGRGTAPLSAATVSSASVGEGQGVKSLADLNRRNHEFKDYQPAPLVQRRRDGSVSDPLFGRRHDPLFESLEKRR